jgi:hypothetical protein
MKSRTGRMLLLAVGVLLGFGNAYALGAKGDGMEHRGAGMMKDDGSMKKHDDGMMKDETIHDGSMKDSTKKNREPMKKENGMKATGGEKAGTMKDTMK